MPFTLSHPAIVLPLRRYFSLTGLVIGSMSPDFEYFVRMNLQSEYGHTFWGTFYFCLPISMIVSFLYHYYIRNSLIMNLPYFFQRRFARFKDFHWGNYCKEKWFLVIISILIGAFSHILWDSFTHKTGFFVQQFSFLQESIFESNNSFI